MALTTTPITNPIAAAIVIQSVISATGNMDVRAGASTVYQVDIDNSLNAAATFVKLYDAAAPTIGTTAPDFVFKVPAGARRVITLGLEGTALTNLSIAGVTTGGTAGTTNPASACIVRILCT